MKSFKTCNHKDHENWNRRSFIQALGIGGLSSMMLGSSKIAFSQDNKLTNAISTADSDNILIVVRLFGGNDGLNTIIPLNQYDAYVNARPTLRIEENNLWNLSDEYAMPNHMNSLESMWNEGKMKVVHSVGYNDQSQSHFKGQDIWASAKEDNSYETGWLGRYFEDSYPDYNTTQPEMPTAIQIGSSKNISFNTDKDQYSFSVENINRLKAIANTGTSYSLEDIPDCTRGDKLKFMRSITNSTYKYADVIYEAYNSSTDYTSGVGYEADNFSSSLSVISRLIKGNLGTKVFMLTLSGFDTHTAQANAHQELLTTLSNAMTYFYEDLNNAGLGDKVLTMTISEFGRRVYENGGKGTDHGMAGPVMFFGNSLNGNGFIGEHSSLEDDDLVNSRDLQHHTDFKQIYATILKEWMCVDESIVDSVILDKNYKSIDLGFSCTSLDIEEIESPITSNIFTTHTFYEYGSTYLILNSNSTQHTTVELYSLTGQHIGTLKNSVLQPKTYKIDVKQSINGNLSRGYYIYTITTNRKRISRKIMIL